MLTYLVLFSVTLVTIWNLYNTSLSSLGITWKFSAYSTINNYPTVSIIIPAKNEEKQLPRIIDRLIQQEYDREKMEIIVAESGSTDNTLDVCMKYAENYRLIKCLSINKKGKAAALNAAMDVAKGEIVAVFDADTIPKLDALKSAAGQFEKRDVAAVQGKLLPINVNDSLASRFAALEELLYEYSIAGRARLGGFVPLNGTCMFIRSSVLREVGLWNENTLTEDLDLSLRLTAKNYKVIYVPSVLSWREVAPSLRALIKQRLRWYRGHLEISMKELGKPTLKIIDAITVVFTPMFMAISLLDYSLVIVVPREMLLVFGSFITLSSLFTFIVAVIISKKHMIGIPYAFVSYVYIQLVVILHITAIFMEIFRFDRTWERTLRRSDIFKTPTPT
ncbi:glycosyl transferase family 2 [Sulfolobales archaeon HS-7]|nr:glycosyl transferase family 2 [Sulfolobales archaeon HS-7]